MSTTGNDADPGTFDELIFKRDLNEVHLLLDFISGRPNTMLWDLDTRIPNPADGHDLTPHQVIEWVCRLRYPPQLQQSTEEKAFNSALLLYVKDKLNALAYPARGMTIAYTYIFLEETAPLRQGETKRVNAQTRASVARTAYPGLTISAKRFRRFHKTVAWAGGILTGLAAVLLWLVVYGVQITTRFEEDQKRTVDVTSQIYAEIDKENATLPHDKQNHDSVPKRCCYANVESQSNQIKTLCNQWSYYQARYDKSIEDAAMFATRPPSSYLMKPFPAYSGFEPGQTAPAAPDAACPVASPTPAQNQAEKTAFADPPVRRAFVAKQENIQSITLILSAYASYVLPVMFGIVGTIASFLRDIGGRITDSTLAPRDETLAIIRLVLGAIAGLAVGLFFSPASVATQISSGAGVLTLSASAMAFLAGYGADGFFKMIDGIINRAFSLERNDKPPTLH